MFIHEGDINVTRGLQTYLNLLFILTGSFFCESFFKYLFLRKPTKQHVFVFNDILLFGSFPAEDQPSSNQQQDAQYENPEVVSLEHVTFADNSTSGKKLNFFRKFLTFFLANEFTINLLDSSQSLTVQVENPQEKITWLKKVRKKTRINSSDKKHQQRLPLLTF